MSDPKIEAFLSLLERIVALIESLRKQAKDEDKEVQPEDTDGCRE